MSCQLVLALSLAVAVRAGAQPVDDAVYLIDRLGIRYEPGPHPDLPRVRRLQRLEVTLGRSDTGFVAPRADVPSITLTLEQIESRPVEPYHASAVQEILQTILAFINERGISSVFVGPDPLDIDALGQDLRPEGRTSLRLVVTVARVGRVRTLASGDRIDPAERLDNPVHRRIVERSPIHPEPAADGTPRDLLYGDELDRYIYRLSRHPGRRVDAAIAPGIDPGTITLDYLVTESRPLSLWAEIANTGTAQTRRLRERFGLSHTQLTDNDDIFTLQYVTTGFDLVHGVVASYDAPLAGTDSLRWRGYGGYNRFTASEVGDASDSFTGESWVLGADLTWNVRQERDLFVDLVAGARFEHIRVDNQAVGVAGSEGFFLPHLGVVAGREARWFAIRAALFAEWNATSVTPPDPVQLNRLGRLFPDADWGVLKWDLAASAYLEPLLNHAAWMDASTPQSSTLAHEVAVAFRGQYAFDNRLIPQVQQVVGGMTSVRGYPESAVAGDTALVASLEYRFHLPRALPLDPQPPTLMGRPFRLAPQEVYGRPDWDLVLKGFVDAGTALVSDPLFFEFDSTLVGAGIGMDALFRQNVRVRVDWAFALSDIPERDVNAGSNRLHFSVSVYY